MKAALAIMLFSAASFSQIREIPLPPVSAPVIAVGASPNGTIWINLSVSSTEKALYIRKPGQNFLPAGNIRTAFSDYTLYGYLFSDTVQPQDSATYIGVGTPVQIGTPGVSKYGQWNLPYKVENGELVQVCAEKNLKFDGSPAKFGALLGPTLGTDGKLLFAGTTGNETTFYSATPGTCELAGIATVPFQVAKFWKIGSAILATRIVKIEYYPQFSIYEVVRIAPDGSVTTLASPGPPSAMETIPWSCSLQADPKSGTAAYTWSDQTGNHARFLLDGAWKTVYDSPGDGSHKYLQAASVSGNYVLLSEASAASLFAINARTGKLTTVWKWGDTVLGLQTPAGGGSTNQTKAIDSGGTAYFLISDSAHKSFKLAAYDTEAAILPVSVSLSANPAGITAGASSRLCVTAQNAASAAIDKGVGIMDLSTSPACVTVTPTATTTYTATAYAAIGGGMATATATVTVAPPGPPKPAVWAMVVATGSGDAQLVPGGLFTVYGTDLCGVVSDSTLTPSVVTVNTRPAIPKIGTLYTDFGRCRVLIDGNPVPLTFGITWGQTAPHQSQINGQIPRSLAPGPHTVVVERRKYEDDSLDDSSEPFAITVAPSSPSLFADPVQGLQVILQDNSDYLLVTGNHPARPGSVLIGYGTGFGQLDRPLGDGLAPLDAGMDGIDPVRTPAKAWVKVKKDGNWSSYAATLLYAVASPQFVGVEQLGIVIPPEIAADADCTTAYLIIEQDGTYTPDLAFAFAPGR